MPMLLALVLRTLLAVRAQVEPEADASGTMAGGDCYFAKGRLLDR